MHASNIRFCFGILLSLLFSACILKFDLDPDNRPNQQGIVVIEGILSNSLEERIIRVNRQGGDGGFNKLEATGNIFKDGELWSILEPDTNGLHVPEDLIFEEGVSYHVELLVEDSLTYHSKPQLVYPKLEIDSMGFEVTKRLERNSSNINVLREFVDVYAHVTLSPSSEKKEYYYWNVDEAWSFTEIADPRFIGDIPKTCYPTLPISVHPATLISNDQVISGPAEILIANRLIDESFLEKHYFTAYLRAIDPASFIFYKDASKLRDDSGNLFQQFPGTLKGNVFSPDNIDELVMGNVAVALVDTLHFPINNYELKARIFDVCTAENLLNNPIRCFDCTYAFGAESLIKPYYWE